MKLKQANPIGLNPTSPTVSHINEATIQLELRTPFVQFLIDGANPPCMSVRMDLGMDRAISKKVKSNGSMNTNNT